MKKFLKLIAVLAVACIALLVAALITLKIMFPAEKLKAMAQDYAQKTLHREVSFSDVSLNLIGFTLDDFAVSERGTFAENGTFLKADKAVAKIALKPLLKKRVEIASVGLEGMDVNVINGKDGKLNFDDLLSSSVQTPEQAQTSEPASASSFGFALTAERIYAADCNVYYKDLQNGMDASVTHLNLEITDFDLDNPFGVSLNFTTDYQDKTGLAVTIPVSTQLKVYLAGLDLGQAYATLNNLSLTYKNIKFSALGGAKNFNHPLIDLSGKISGVSDAALSDVLPDLPRFVLPDIAFTASAEADLNQSSAVIKQAALSIADSAVTAKGKAGWAGATPTYNLTAAVNLNLSQIAAMTDLLDGYGMGGYIDGNLTATDKNDGQDVSGTVKLSNLTVQYDPFVVSDINGVINIKSLADISCAKLTGLLNGEAFTSSFAYKNLNPVLDLLFNFDLAKFTLDKLPSFEQNSAAAEPASGDVPAAEETSGPEMFFNVKANINIGDITVPYFASRGLTLQADLKKASPSMKQANGEVSFNLQEGAVKDLNLFVKENRIVKILMLPLTIVKTVTSKLGIDIFPVQNKEEKGQIKFSSGSGTYAFTNGIMNIRETHFDSAVSNMKASGSLNFKTEALDMKVTATVLTSQTPVVIKIGGTMSNPSGKLDVAGTAASLVGGILNYKTPVKVAGSAAQTATDATKAVTNAGAEAVKGTVGAAVGAIKGLGGLFKKNKTDEDAPEK